MKKKISSVLIFLLMFTVIFRIEALPNEMEAYTIYSSSETDQMVKNSIYQPSEDLRVLFLSDFHYGGNNHHMIVGGYKSHDERMEIMIDAINKENKKDKIDFIIATGDMTNNDIYYKNVKVAFDKAVASGNESQIAAARLALDNFYGSANDYLSYVANEVFPRFDVPVYAVRGNHDAYEPDKWEELFGHPTEYIIDYGDTAFIILDNFKDDSFTTSPNSCGFTNTTQEVMDKMLEATKHKNKVYVVSHYVNSGDSVLVNAISSTDNILGSFCGHDHVEDVKTVGSKPLAHCGNFVIFYGTNPYNGQMYDFKYSPWNYRILEHKNNVSQTYITYPEAVYYPFTFQTYKLEEQYTQPYLRKSPLNLKTWEGAEVNISQEKEDIKYFKKQYDNLYDLSSNLRQLTNTETTEYGRAKSFNINLPLPAMSSGLKIFGDTTFTQNTSGDFNTLNTIAGQSEFTVLVNGKLISVTAPSPLYSLPDGTADEITYKSDTGNVIITRKVGVAQVKSATGTGGSERTETSMRFTISAPGVVTTAAGGTQYIYTTKGVPTAISNTTSTSPYTYSIGLNNGGTILMRLPISAIQPYDTVNTLTTENTTENNAILTAACTKFLAANPFTVYYPLRESQWTTEVLNIDDINFPLKAGDNSIISNTSIAFNVNSGLESILNALQNMLNR